MAPGPSRCDTGLFGLRAGQISGQASVCLNAGEGETDNIEIEEFFAGLGAVRIKRLFGGRGIYFEGLIVGIVRQSGELLLKADAESAPRFEAAGATQWTHVDRRGKTSSMPYWTIPADAFDDPESMADWVKLAFGAAKRAADHG